jgi:hypothetical protein
MRDIKGLATGIGSLPHKDANAALDLIFKYTPQIPFWPQLPKRDKREGMISQFSQRLPCLGVNQKGLFFDSSNQEQELAVLYEHVIANDTEYFKISPDFAVGLWGFLSRLEREDISRIEFIKGQTTGPFTFAASINDNEGKAIFHNSLLMQAVLEGLAMKARWQINLFRKFGKPIILFLDEPYLACFGSGFTPINRQDVVSGLAEFTKRIESPEVLIGVHCCGNTDWSIFTEVPNIDIVSFDAFNFLERILLYAHQLITFFKRGGILAWGIVPTGDFSPQIDKTILAERLQAGLNVLVNKGIDEELLKKRLILTPSCGLGALGFDKAEPIFECLDGLSSVAQTESY